MKPACVILTIIIIVAIVAVCLMVKFATEITVEERKRDIITGGTVYKFGKSMGVIALKENTSLDVSDRFPYVAAVITNYSSTWSFACFGSIILIRWVVTSAHCHKPDSIHRVLLYYDFIRNYTHTYPILFWRVHEKFQPNQTSLNYDIAIAKLNVDIYPFPTRPAIFDEKSVTSVEAGIWKTVSTMDKRAYLTNDFDKLALAIAGKNKCFETYGIDIDDSLICIDMSAHEDCFVHEFGPIYFADKVIGVLNIKPRDCDNKLAIFTNVSFYSDWILRTAHVTYLL